MTVPGLLGLTGSYDGKWMQYGINEGLPLLDATTTTPNLGTGVKQEAMFTVVGHTCTWYMQVFWGASASAGSGTYGLLAPPPEPYVASPGGTQNIGYFNCGQDAFAQINLQQASVNVVPNFGFPILPARRQALILPPKYSRTGTATIASGGSSVAVTTPLGNGMLVKAWPAASPNPALSAVVSGVTVPGVWWVDTITTAGFTIHSQAADNFGNSHAALLYTWAAYGPENASSSGLFVTDSYPWAWGGSTNNFEAGGSYRIAD